MSGQRTAEKINGHHHAAAVVGSQPQEQLQHNLYDLRSSRAYSCGDGAESTDLMTDHGGGGGENGAGLCHDLNRPFYTSSLTSSSISSSSRIPNGPIISMTSAAGNG